MAVLPALVSEAQFLQYRRTEGKAANIRFCIRPMTCTAPNALLGSEGTTGFLQPNPLPTSGVVMKHLMKYVYRCLLAVAVAGLGMGASAHAQGGSCHDPWINQAYNQLYHVAPSGSQTSGQCNPALYGGGHWTTFADLTNKVKVANCNDPWIVQAYMMMILRPASGSGTSGECNPALYGGGHWTSLNDLEAKVVAYHRPPAAAPAPSPLLRTGPATPMLPLSPIPQKVNPNAPPLDLSLAHSAAAEAAIRLNRGSYTVNSRGDLVDARGKVICAAGTYSLSPTGAVITNYGTASSIVAQGGGNIVAQGGGNIVAQGGGNIVAQGGGNIVAQGGGNLVPAAGMRVNINN